MKENEILKKKSYILRGSLLQEISDSFLMQPMSSILSLKR
jgi:hypothetical protein